METVISILGLVGAFFVVSMYFLIQQGKVNGESLFYYIINGIGGFLILISVVYSFDGGDMGAIAVEAAWVVISLMGIVKFLKKKKNA